MIQGGSLTNIKMKKDQDFDSQVSCDWWWVEMNFDVGNEMSQSCSSLCLSEFTVKNYLFPSLSLCKRIPWSLHHESYLILIQRTYVWAKNLLTVSIENSLTIFSKSQMSLKKVSLESVGF